jgi:hypothetical protein
VTGRWFLTRYIIRTWKWRRYVPPKCWLIFNKWYGVISQNIKFFITTAARTFYSGCDVPTKTFQIRSNANTFHNYRLVWDTADPRSSAWRHLFHIMHVGYTNGCYAIKLLKYAGYAPCPLQECKQHSYPLFWNINEHFHWV